MKVVYTCALDTGTTLPLVGAEQNRQGMPPLPSNQPSPAIMDVTENMRAKIYALCTKLGFQCPADSLTTEDKITMCIIQSYLDFKVININAVAITTNGGYC